MTETEREHQREPITQSQALRLLLRRTYSIEQQLSVLAEIVLRVARADKQRDVREMATLEELKAKAEANLEQVRKNGDLGESIIKIVKDSAAQIIDLRKKLEEAGTDPAKLAELGTVMDALAAQATANGQKLADAAMEGTGAT